MLFDFPKALREIDLTEYAPEYNAKITTWVNPPREKIHELQAAMGEVTDNPQRLADVLIELWSQGADKWSADDINKFMAYCDEYAPALFVFCVRQTQMLIAEHRVGAKKKPTAPPSS